MLLLIPRDSDIRGWKLDGQMLIFMEYCPKKASLKIWELKAGMLTCYLLLLKIICALAEMI